MSIYDNIALVRDVTECNKKTEGNIIACYSLCLKTAVKGDEATKKDTREAIVKANLENFKVLCNKKVVMTITQKVDIKKLMGLNNKSYETYIKIYNTLLAKGHSKLKIGSAIYNFLLQQMKAVNGSDVLPLDNITFVDITNALDNFKFKVEETESAEDTEDTAKNTEAVDCWTKELLEVYNSLSSKDRELSESITLPEGFREYGQHFTNIEYSDEVEMNKELDNKFIEILGDSAMSRIISNDNLAVRLAIEGIRDTIQGLTCERIPLKLTEKTTSELAEHYDLNKLIRKIFAINQENKNAQCNGIKALLVISYAPISEYETKIRALQTE